MRDKFLYTINGLKALLTKEQTQILKAATLLMIPALLTKATGLLFTLLTSTLLGSNDVFNSFLLANEIPAFLAEIILTGAVSTLVIPIFIQAKEKSKDEFLRFYNSVVNALMGGFGVIALVVILFATPIFDFTVNNIIRPETNDCLYLFRNEPGKYQRLSTVTDSEGGCLEYHQRALPYLNSACMDLYFNNINEYEANVTRRSIIRGSCSTFHQEVVMANSVNCLYYSYNNQSYFQVLQQIPESLNGCSNLDVSQIVNMMRVLMIPQLILGLSVFVASGLNVYNRFLLPQLAPLFYNVGRIFAVFIIFPLSQSDPLDSTTGSPWALVAGVVIGAVLHLAIQLPLANALGIKYMPVIEFSKYFRKFILVTIPRLVAYTADSFGVVVNRLIIAGFNFRFISVMFYASALANMIPGVIGYAFSVASYPTLSRLYTQKKFDEINDIVIRMLNQILFLAAPIILTLVVLRLAIVRLAFGLLPGTEFDRQLTVMVGWTLLFLALGIIFSTAKWYLYRLFYVAQNTIVPFFVSFFSLVLTVVLTLGLGNLFSHANEFSFAALEFKFSYLFESADGLPAVGGAALAITITALVEFIILIFLIDRFVFKFDIKRLAMNWLNMFIPIGITGVLMYLMYSTWNVIAFPIDADPNFQGSTTFNLFILTGVTVFSCFMVYYLICYLMGVDELKVLRRFLNPVFKIIGVKI